METDIIARVLDCITLRWYRTEKAPRRFYANRKLGLVRLESLKGLVHVVRKDA